MATGPLSHRRGLQIGGALLFALAAAISSMLRSGLKLINILECKPDPSSAPRKCFIVVFEFYEALVVRCRAQKDMCISLLRILFFNMSYFTRLLVKSTALILHAPSLCLFLLLII